MENSNIVIPTLEPDDIEVKIKQVTQKGAFALLYKTSRTDMRILDEVFGVKNWQVDYEMIGEMLFCTISVWDDEKKQWIRKQSNGIESREDGEGNEAKGWASDSMKRAGFLLGCGRELYSSPRIFLNVATKQDGEFKGKPIFKLEDQWAKYIVTDIHYDAKRKIDKLVIANEKTGEIVYRYGVSGTTAKKQAVKEDAPKKTVEKKAETQPVENKPPVNVTVEKATTIPNPEIKPHERVFRAFLEKHKIDRDKFKELRALAIRGGKNVTQKKFNELLPDEWVTLIATMEGLWEEGFFKGVA